LDEQAGSHVIIAYTSLYTYNEQEKLTH